jgi:uncharacterized protein YkwD
MAKNTRYRYRSVNYRGGKFNWQSFLSIALICILALISSKDFLYFDNGRGETDWKIGSSTISVINAHQARSLVENRELALQLTNRDRQLNGLLPLVEDPLLSQTAQFHAQDMLTRHYYAHITPEGKNPTDRFAQQGGHSEVGENIVQMKGSAGTIVNYRLIEKFQKSWMYSSGHRANLLKPEYLHFGYGIVADSFTGQVYGVQNFSLPER